jgi:hypothetical protein
MTSTARSVVLHFASLRYGAAVGALRTQAALVRTLVDEFERLAPLEGEGLLVCEQLLEELTRLGCRILETAAALAREHEAERSRRQ